MPASADCWGEVVARLAGREGDDDVRVLGLDALDDAGVVLGADVDAEDHRLHPAGREPVLRLLRGRDPVVGVLGEDRSLLDPRDEQRVLPDGGGRPRAERGDPEDVLLLVAGDRVVPGLGEDDRDAARVGDVLRGDPDRAVVAAADRDDPVLGDELLHDRGRLLRQALGVGDDDLDLAAEHPAGRVEVLFGDQHRVAHRLAADDRAGGRQGSEPADGDLAFGERRGVGPEADGRRRRGQDRLQDWLLHRDVSWGKGRARSPRRNRSGSSPEPIRAGRRRAEGGGMLARPPVPGNEAAKPARGEAWRGPARRRPATRPGSRPLPAEGRRSADGNGLLSRRGVPSGAGEGAGSGGLHGERGDVPRFAAELHPDQVDRVPEMPVLVGVALLLELGHRGAGRRLPDHLELEQVHLPVVQRRHVQPAAGGALLHAHVQPRGGEPGVEHARVVPLVARDVVLRVPLVGDPGEERPEQRLQPGEIVRGEKLAQRAVLRQPARGGRQQGAQQVLVQALAYFMVRVAQTVADAAVAILRVPNRQITGLEQQRLGGHLVHVEGGEQGLGAAHPVQLRGAYAAPKQRVDQERRRAGLEPVRPELAAPEQEQDVEGVVDLLLPEPAISVVPAADLPAVQPRELRREHRVEVPFRVAADRGVRRVQGEVDEVVEA